MKRFVIAIALTCVLSVSAFAGEIPMTVTATTTNTPDTNLLTAQTTALAGTSEDDDSTLPAGHGLTLIFTILGIVV